MGGTHLVPFHKELIPGLVEGQRHRCRRDSKRKKGQVEMSVLVFLSMIGGSSGSSSHAVNARQPHGCPF